MRAISLPHKCNLDHIVNVRIKRTCAWSHLQYVFECPSVKVVILGPLQRVETHVKLNSKTWAIYQIPADKFNPTTHDEQRRDLSRGLVGEIERVPCVTSGYIVAEWLGITIWMPRSFAREPGNYFATGYRASHWRRRGRKLPSVLNCFGFWCLFRYRNDG